MARRHREGLRVFAARAGYVSGCEPCLSAPCLCSSPVWLIKAKNKHRYIFEFLLPMLLRAICRFL